MSTDRYHIDVSGIPIEVVRKNIKNLHVGVYPPEGKVRVAAPLRLDQDSIRLAILSRLGWIRRQQVSFSRQQRQSFREYRTGESHYVDGCRYRLNVVEHPGLSSITLKSRKTILLKVPPGTDTEERGAIVDRWYRRRLMNRIDPLLAKLEQRIGVNVAEVRIKKMKTLWGSCNAPARRIWLNLELAKKSQSCLEYILVHEMVHLVERHHNIRFREIMDKVMPSWRHKRDDLNRVPLSHEEWRY